MASLSLLSIIHPSMPSVPEFLKVSMKAFEESWKLGFRYADARVAHRKLDITGAPAQRYADGALKRMFESVRKQIEDDLLPHLSVDVHGFG